MATWQVVRWKEALTLSAVHTATEFKCFQSLILGVSMFLSRFEHHCRVNGRFSFEIVARLIICDLAHDGVTQTRENGNKRWNELLFSSICRGKCLCIIPTDSSQRAGKHSSNLTTLKPTWKYKIPIIWSKIVPPGLGSNWNHSFNIVICSKESVSISLTSLEDDVNIRSHWLKKVSLDSHGPETDVQFSLKVQEQDKSSWHDREEKSSVKHYKLDCNDRKQRQSHCGNHDPGRLSV